MTRSPLIAAALFTALTAGYDAPSVHLPRKQKRRSVKARNKARIAKASRQFNLMRASGKR